MTRDGGGGGDSQPIDVHPSDLATASQTFATGQDTLVTILDTLFNSLDGCAGMAGNDDTGHKFGAKYDPAAAALINTMCAAVRSVGGMSTGLVTNANNYVQAEHHSTVGTKPSLVYFQEPGVRIAVSYPAPSSAIGPGDSFLPGPLSKYWPNGHPDKLRQAATALRKASGDIQTLGTTLHGAVNKITDVNSSSSVTAMTTFWAQIWKDGPDAGKVALSASHQGCDTLAQLCEKYAKAIDDAHSSVESSLAGAGIAIGLTSAVGALLTVFTGGGSDVGAAALDGAEASGILGGALAEFNVAVDAALEDAYLTEIVPLLQAAAEDAPSLDALAAESTDVGTVLDDEMAATEAREPASVGGRGGGTGNDPPSTGGGGGTPAGDGGPENWSGGGDDPSLVADKIAAHAGDRTVPGVEDADVPEYLEDIMSKPGYPLRSTPGGTPRMAWWDSDTGTMVIREGGNGTFMQPDRGYAYFLEQLAE